jgi:hypothetical protein
MLSPELRRKFKRLRKTVHDSMKVEAERRIKENPKPTEEELHLGVFLEWLWRCGLASMYPASDWSMCSRPSWISARV